MHIVRESDIPIMSDNANCMNSLLSALKYIYMQAATTYKNNYRWDAVGSILIVLFVVVLLIELLSKCLKRIH